MSVTGFFLQTVVYPRFGQADTAAYNAVHREKLADYSDFRLPERVPGEDQPELRASWLEFARGTVNPSFVAVDGLDDESWRDHLAERDAPAELVASATAPGDRWLSGREREFYEAYLREAEPGRLRLVGPEFAWAAEQPDLPPMQATLGQLERLYVAENAGSIRWDFVSRNYINVWNELTVQGRVLLNTAMFCGLAIVLSLLVNPLAAYALSRYRLPSTYKILLFLIATMAFPPMVTMIPQFVMLRNLGLLNTFAALVLPLIVNGYMIFLLKGFFDALPQELYEAATIDGAGRGADVLPDHDGAQQADPRDPGARHLHRRVHDVPVPAVGRPRPGHVADVGVALPVPAAKHQRRRLRQRGHRQHPHADRLSVHPAHDHARHRRAAGEVSGRSAGSP